MRKQLIQQMVDNYYLQVEIVKSYGEQAKISLREYLQGIKDTSPTMIQDEVEYGVTLEVKE